MSRGEGVDQVDHDDNDPDNCTVGNLKVLTRLQNRRKAQAAARRRKAEAKATVRRRRRMSSSH